MQLIKIYYRSERQSAWMSKITNDGLTRSGTGCFIGICTHMTTVGVKGLTLDKLAVVCQYLCLCWDL